MNALELATDQLSVKQRELEEMFKAHPEYDFSDDQLAEVKKRNAELTDLGTKVSSLRETDAIAKSNRDALAASRTATLPVAHSIPESPIPDVAQTKTLGELFIESAAFKGYRENRSINFSSPVDYDVKTLMTTSAGFAPQAIRTGQVIPSAQQQPRIVDIVPATTTDQVAVVYMQETTFTNNAAETAEGGQYPEAALAYTQVTAPVVKIAVVIPVTDEQLADIQGMQDRINNRLVLMLRQRLDTQIVNGNGSGANMTGWANQSGILTQAQASGDTDIDTIFKAITKVRFVGFAEPNAIVLNPTQWQNIRLLRTADGDYLFGPPGMPVPDMLWGLPVIQSTYVTSATGFVADFATYTELAYKAQMEFEVSNSHSDYFEKGQLAIRAQLRCANVVYRTNAICALSSLA